MQKGSCDCGIFWELWFQYEYDAGDNESQGGNPIGKVLVIMNFDSQK